MGGKRREIKGTGCDTSDETDQFSALAPRRKIFPWSVVCADKLSGLPSRVEKQARLPATSSPHTAGTLNKTASLLTVPLCGLSTHLLPSTLTSQLCRKETACIRRWQG